VLAVLVGCSPQTETVASTGTPVAVDGAEVMVPMPDGIGLATTVYLPRDGEGPWPTMLVRTPYGRDDVAEFVLLSRILPEAGVALVLQTQRGRRDSEGDDVGFFGDTADGHATLDWIVSQPWSNGRVATEGASAQGISQYLLAPGASDALTCQWIETATPNVYSAAFQGGVFREALVRGWLEQTFSSHLIGEYQARPLDDEYWDPVDTTRRYGDVRVPAFHVGGYYDILVRSTIDGFLGYQYEGGEGAADRQHLVLGPWTHAINDPAAGEVTYPEAVVDELWGWQTIWYDACLVGGLDMAELDALPTVTYYTMGALGEDDAPGNAWHTADTWPPEGFAEVEVYLRGDGALGLEPPTEAATGDLIVYDPGDPAPTVCGANLTIEAGSCDQRSVEERDDVVVYTSPVLESPIEVTGDLRAEIWIATDVPDTDIVVRLTDVYPDGRSMLIADGILRARYHGSPDFTSFELLEPGTAYLLSVDLGPTSIIFNAGHRIRLSVTSSNWPRFSINPNTGEMYLEDGHDGRIAHTEILRDAEHPSALVVPTR
jgi:predicted acyl esterase